MGEVRAAVGGLETAEGEFVRVVRELCCEGCVEGWTPEQVRAWEAEARAAAAALVAEGR
ncbi:hypothetical protein [Kitasatospora griseola]|uniref:hypothetical protein n=1 Tax=Kitasatospora griseola TaxID=2064 RepID=UPI003800501A